MPVVLSFEPLRASLTAFTLVAVLVFGGCAKNKVVKKSPSPFGEDNVTYFAPGTKYQLSPEAAAQQTLAAEQRIRALGAQAGHAAACSCCNSAARKPSDFAPATEQDFDAEARLQAAAGRR